MYLIFNILSWFIRSIVHGGAMRLLGIFGATILFFALSLTMARFWGLSLPHQEFKHAFFQSPSTFIFKVQNIGQANDALKVSPNAIFWLDVRISQDNQFFIQSPHELQTVLNEGIVGKKFLGNKPYFYDYSFIKSLLPDVKTLEDFLTQFPQQRFVLNIIDNHQNVHSNLNKTIQPFSPNDRILFHSDTDGIIQHLKNEKPFWLFGMSLPELTRVLTFDSIGLGPAIQVRGDVLVSPLLKLDREFVTESLLSEMRRRKKRILLGPFETDSQVQKAVEYHQKSLSDGFVLSNMNQWRLIDSQIGNKLQEPRQ